MAAVNSEPSSASARPPYASSSMRPVELLSNPLLPPPFGPSSSYAQTSQGRNWRFSHSKLSSIRSAINASARDRLSTLWAEESSSTSPSTIPFLSVSDELSLITYYLVKVSQIVHALRLPELVEATATTFVKRFYLRNTVMDFHPKNIVITCIFLASKAENYPLNLSDFARKLAGRQANENRALVEENRKVVLELEFLVSQSLNFEYGVTGAHRSMYGLLLDIQAMEKVKVGREEVHMLAAEAHGKLGKSRLTDAEFVYTPSQIALACVRMVEPKGKEVVTSWLDWKEELARNAGLEAKKRRVQVREQETARAAKAKIALARRLKGKAGAKIAEDQVAAAASIPSGEVEFEDELLETQPLGMSRHELEAVLDEIQKMIEETENGGYTGKGKGADDLERIKAIDARQKQCMNPENVPGTKLFRKRRAEDDGEEEEAEGRSGKRARGADSDDDADVPEADGLRAKPDPQV
ncbi:hypothetical protein PHSY_003351 [Pseudozyma hubeiensis SY62]|uniref:Cyclin-like domain-containing protein n=1 Tax=Pseudozyma hubeiensis (strain SY62) TaxID=1305764 RepID=R9PCI0_PSEHS|nr:hypothetical protein PHSY_003351 [Pseudozyma hubeiensis SY62]GAC95775.1 hypothetical protein PHSY_003351 [Pseudozyma hubeiensis SY62]